MVPICGIFGISYGPDGPAAEDWTPTELASLMFPAIIHRGPHAWGYMFCPQDASEIRYVKSPGRADTRTALASIDIPDDVRWMVGHVRYATNGAPEDNVNNHPIHHHSVVGVHNGVLQNWQGIIKTTGRSEPSALVDSEAIFAAVHKWGLRQGLARIYGNAVAVFSTTDAPEVLRIARTHGRPLVYTRTSGGALVFASECGVIDSTGIEHGEVTDFNGRNRLLTVRGGKITERLQFRAPEPVQEPQKRTPWVDTRGITDRMSSLTTPHREARVGANGTLMYNKQDRFGGTYVGANMWRTPDNHYLNAEQYVEWAITTEAAREASARTDRPTES